MKIIKYSFVLALLAFSMQIAAQTTKWREMHKVKKKETIFGIARDYGLTIDQLIKANPEMTKPGYELKKGDFIFIPYADEEQRRAAQAAQAAKTVQETTAKTATKTASKTTSQTGKTQTTTLNRTSAQDDVRKRAIRVGIMLPLHDVDGDGRRMIEYYRGVLLACDSIKKHGVSVDVHAWNVPIDADIRQTLLEKEASQCDVIFGPLYTKQMKALSDFVRNNNIKLVVPFSIYGIDVTMNPNIYQIYQTPTTINEATIKCYLERFAKHNTVIVDCNDSTSQKGVFTMNLRKQMEAKGMKFSITNLKSSDEAFSRAFSRTLPNVVVLNTGRSPELNTAFARLNKMTAATPGIVISMFGYNEWLMYTKPYQELFHKYDTYVPSIYYYDPQSSKTWRLEKKYRQMFGTDMMYALPRFALTGFDQAYFFLKGLHDKGKAFNATREESDYQPVQTPFNFKRSGKGGGMQNYEFMLVHYAFNKGVEKLEIK